MRSTWIPTEAYVSNYFDTGKSVTSYSFVSFSLFQFLPNMYHFLEKKEEATFHNVALLRNN